MTALGQISEILRGYSFHMADSSLIDVPLFKRIAGKMELGQPLIFLLPAFPAKSPSPLKTSKLPDFNGV